MHARHVTNPRKASPNESEHDTWTSHGSMGPPERLNGLKSTCTPGTYLRAHRTSTSRNHTPSGAHLGSADPRIGRTDLGTADPGLPLGASIGPRGRSRGVSLLFAPVLRPINRRGGGSFLTNTPYSSSLTFGF
jgi:hypothetical protein